MVSEKVKTKDRWVRLVTQALVISVAVNIGFIVTFLSSAMKDRNYSMLYPRIDEKSEISHELDLSGCLNHFSTFSFRRLAACLSKNDSIEEGYAIRDLALACLIKFHHFDIEAALPGQKLQKREHQYGEKKIELISNLKDHQYDSIIHYVYTEKWPITSYGVFALLQSLQEPIDPTLKEAFFVKEEFCLARMMFQRANSSIKNEDILQLLLEGDFEILSNFVKKQRSSQDFSSEVRREFLLGYIFQNSFTAAYLLLQTDFLYAVKKLDDPTVLSILGLLSEKSEDAEQFCYELIKSSRSDAVWQKSAELLYGYVNEEFSLPYNHNETLNHFVYSKSLQQKWEEPLESLGSMISESKSRVYIVQENDTLWKIARQYKVDLDELIEINNVCPDRMQTGQVLKIPKSR